MIVIKKYTFWNIAEILTGAGYNLILVYFLDVENIHIYKYCI